MVLAGVCMPLTEKKVRALAKAGRHFDKDGLYLQILSKKNRSWLLRYQIDGRERWMGLGSVRDFTLTEARERARKQRQLLRDGVDPIEARRAARAASRLAAAKVITFGEAAQQYYDAMQKGWRNAKHRAQFLSTIKAYANPKLERVAITAVDTALVLQVLDPIWQQKTETANRVRSRIEKVLDWAKSRGYRDGENPARWKGHLQTQLVRPSKIAKAQHHAALPYANVCEFVAALAKREGVAARALEFTILTAVRTGEAIGAKWREIDFDRKIWTIPADRMKAHKEHRVPLSARAVQILEELPREGEYVFVGGKANAHLSNMAMAQTLKRMKREDITVHGFRSTFRDWAAECTHHRNEVVEMAMAHTIKSAVEAAYRRGHLLEKRAKLMDDWARYCTTKPDASNVTPLRAAR